MSEPMSIGKITTPNDHGHAMNYISTQLEIIITVSARDNKCWKRGTEEVEFIYCW